MKKLLLIPRIEIQNANALSSPHTIGFPAMTAWLGGTHALQRKLNRRGFEKIVFKSMAVVCHKIDLQAHKGDRDFVYSLIGTANPLEKKGKEFVRPAFIEEARCHLEISLVIEYEGLNVDDPEDFIRAVQDQLYRMKLASGDILRFKLPERFIESNFRELIRRLMPGHLLIERRDLMEDSMQVKKDDGTFPDAIEVLLDHLSVKHRSEKQENDEASWSSRRKTPGWIVPIATGFHGITEVGKALNQRDEETPHRFAESIVTLGEFIMPHRVQNIDEMLWHYHVDLEKNLYLCQQNLSYSSTLGENHG